MEKISKIYLFETLLYAGILLITLSIPFISGIYSLRGWPVVLLEWTRFIPFFIVFIINNYLLTSLLLFKGKYLYYILSCILLVVGVVYLSGYLVTLTQHIRPPFERISSLRFPLDSLPFPPRDMPFPRFSDESFAAVGKITPNRPFRLIFNFRLALVSFLLIGFNSGIKSFVKWTEDRIVQEGRNRLYISTELAYLKHQISPHFFMNTLNQWFVMNIYNTLIMCIIRMK